MNKKKNKHSTGFKIPEGYFDEFEVRMFDTLKEERLPKDSGFTVPKDYFEAVEAKILRTETNTTWKVFRNGTPKNKHAHRKTVLYTLAGIAAVLAVVLSLNPLGTHNAVSFDGINATALSAYIQDGALDLTAEDLARYLQNEDLNAIVAPSEEISEESLSDYLFNNLDDNTLLLE